MNAKNQCKLISHTFSYIIGLNYLETKQLLPSKPLLAAEYLTAMDMSNKASTEKTDFSHFGP
jgi:hypothetical protein